MIDIWSTIFFTKFLSQTQTQTNLFAIYILIKHPQHYFLSLKPNFVFKPWRPKCFIQFEIIKNVLVGSFWFIWKPMLWVYAHYKYFYSYSAGIDFRRQTLTCADVSLTTKVAPRAVRVKPSGCITASFYIPEKRLDFSTTKEGKFPWNCYQNMTIFLPTSSHLHPLQVENSRLVVDEDANGKFILERVLRISFTDYNDDLSGFKT